MTLNGDILTIEVDLKQDFGRSSSGKSYVIATSEGNKPVKDDIKIGLNIYKPAKD